MIKDIVNSIYPISENSLKELEELVKYKNFEKGEFVIQKDKRNNDEYFVLEGICRSFLLNPEGEEITISFFTPETILSPHTTRTKNGYSSLNFQACTAIKLALIDASKFEQLMIDNLEIRNFGNTVLRNELKQKVEKEIGLAALTAKERLLKFRKQYSLLENLVPHTEIATYLGITNISLSRLRRELIKGME